MGRDQKSVMAGFQNQLQKIPGVQAQNGPAVGSDVAQALQFVGKGVGRREIREKHQIVVFAGLVVFFVDVADFRFQDEPGVSGAGRRNLLFQGRLDVRFEAEQPGFRLPELFLHLLPPHRMGEIAGGHQLDALDPGRHV